MRALWALSLFFTMLSMGLWVTMTGKQSLMAKPDKPFEEQLTELNKRYEDIQGSQAMLERMVAERTKVLEDQVAEMAKLSPSMEQKKIENEDCQIEQNAKSEELNFKEKEHIEIEANFKTQSDSWSKEIALLTEQLTGHSEICIYMRTNPLAVKLCGPNQLNLS